MGEMKSVMKRFWLGQMSLSQAFWLGWAVPLLAGWLLCWLGEYMLSWLGGFSLLPKIGLPVAVAVMECLAFYAVVAIWPVWKSASACTGHVACRYLARGAVLLGAVIQVLVACWLLYLLIALRDFPPIRHDPDRTAENAAVPSATHPFAGFWKESPGDSFGLAIAPAAGQQYSVSFCGPGGCFEPGTYRPDTLLNGDAAYQIVSADELKVLGRHGWSTYRRAASRTAGVSSSCPDR